MQLGPHDLALSVDFLKFLKQIPSIGVAVSGGSDSLALLHLVAEAAREAGIEVQAATVDHGLRDGSVEEALFVAEVCRGLSVPHQTLHWTAWDGQGNLQAHARAARYELLAAWAKQHDIPQVALGHTADDQAETLIMRLARGAGVDGLTGMADQTSWHGVSFLRPILHLRREALRSYLTEAGQDWRDDPSNADPSYQRIRVRNQMTTLEELGLTPEALAQVAENMRHAKGALDRDLRAQAGRLVTGQVGDLLIDSRGFIDLSFEQARRLLSAALRFVSGRDYAPRREEQIKVLQAVRHLKPATVSGCLLLPEGETIRICREHKAVEREERPIGSLWDHRWEVAGPDQGEFVVRALGEMGLRDCPDWRETGLPRASLVASPAVWRGKTLIAAPIAGNSNGWTAHIVTDFQQWLLSH